jgi:hypothetical protein
MGIDMTWTAERQSTDGTWHTVCSSQWIRELRARADLDTDTLVLGERLGYRDSDRFMLLSDVGGVLVGRRETIALGGLPEDVASGSWEEFGACRDLYGEGHFTLHDLRYHVDLGVDPDTLHHQWMVECMEAYLQEIEDFCACEALTSRILMGPSSMEGDKRSFPVDKDLSGHATLKKARVEETLLPIGDDTIRFVIGYSA